MHFDWIFASEIVRGLSDFKMKLMKLSRSFVNLKEELIIPMFVDKVSKHLRVSNGDDFSTSEGQHTRSYVRFLVYIVLVWECEEGNSRKV